jgi:LAS superfamily LD-carboxypeptidase LdcB
MLDPLALTGRSRGHVVELQAPRCTLHRDAVEPFLAMRGAALAAGIDLVAVSSFRDFDRQRAIWNAKFRGERPVLDRASRALDALALPAAQRVDAILWWSALPGASRHHWGSDLDVIDRAALPADATPQLVPAEFAAGGPFARLDAWLDAHLHRFGFFRPYVSDRGGVSPEPWHLSYAPVSVPAAEALTVEVLREALCAAEAAGVAAAGAGPGVAGLEAVLAALPRIHARYVAATDAPRPGPGWVAAALAEALSPRSRPS